VDAVSRKSGALLKTGLLVYKNRARDPEVGQVIVFVILVNDKGYQGQVRP
jgi:hypothetical protein